MIKIEKILFPTDFSACSKHALKYALDIAVERGAKLYILHVIPKINVPVGTGGLTFPVSKLYDDMENEAKKNIYRLVPKRFMEKIQVENIIIRGTPFQEINKAAQKYDIDLITIATHGRTGLSHAILGSTAERVVRTAPCPVLCVRYRER
ncbi:MAG: universal stress protein [Planctomycetia bacterium]|nr:universal stress protein [Candidatus Brocadia sp.]MEB2309696.1 universal stress protein [Candidatus Brocadiaceae bacterium]QOJ07394.1 MAG: universal stress protein [Planctomycetia bacterium]TVL95113.1 MAG: universal stress protein [Candidatus Brocadia sp. BL1]HQU30861.1 universal stress protein [Candidatus Brocadia sapporoensis]